MSLQDPIPPIATPFSKPTPPNPSVFIQASPSTANAFQQTLENTKAYLLNQAKNLSPEYATKIQRILSNNTQIDKIQEAAHHVLLAWQTQYPNANPELIEKALKTRPLHRDRLEHIEQQMAQSHQKATPSPEGE